MVSRVGFEPTTFTLKGCCSTTELPARGYYTGGPCGWQAFDAPVCPTYNRRQQRGEGTRKEQHA